MMRPNLWSISVSSCSAIPMPHTTPPMIWLLAVLVFRMRPAATALTIAGDTDDAELLVDFHFGENRRVRVVGMRAVIGEGGEFSPARCGRRRHAASLPRSAPRATHRACSRACRPPARPRRASHPPAANSASALPGAAVPRAPRRTVVTIPFDTDAAIHDPPSTGDCGSVESPSLIVTAVERQPQHLGRDLRHDRVSAGADVGGRAGNLRMAVGRQHDAHRDRHLQRFPDAGRHAPADQLGAIAHRARLGAAPVPAESFRALAVALAQVLAAVRLVGVSGRAPNNSAGAARADRASGRPRVRPSRFRAR